MARRSSNIGFDRVNGKTVIFSGGVNEGVTNLELRPGDLASCLNYEEINGVYHGYSSVEGFERFDGTAAPSDVFVKLMYDYGNDANTGVLIESEDASDLIDKSSNGFGFALSGVGATFNTSRYRFGEGSWKFLAGSIGNAVIDQSVSPIDFSGNLFQIDGWLQVDGTTGTTIIAYKSGVFLLSLVDGDFQFEWSTNGGASLNNTLTVATQIISNRWSQFSVVGSEDTGDGTVSLGFNGSHIVTATTIGELMNTNTQDIILGDGFASSASLYLDSFRVSTTGLWENVNGYDYQETWPYSDGRYYTLNGLDTTREATRAGIGKPGTAGPVRGVHVYQGKVYAIRDTVLNVSSGVYVQNVLGWVPMQNIYTSFKIHTSNIPDDSGGTAVALTGQAWTAAASGAYGTISDYVIESGVSPNKIGDMVVWVNTAGPALLAGDVITITSTGDTATVSSTPKIKTMLSGTDVDFVNARLAYYPPQYPNTEQIYFINNSSGLWCGKDLRLFPIQGPVDMIGATPKGIKFFNNRIWLWYTDGHLFYSAVNDINFSSEYGGGELYLGDDIKDMITLPKGSMAVMMKDSIKIISINQPTDTTVDFAFLLDDFTTTSGGFKGTAKTILGDAFYCDDRGPTSMKQGDQFGGFEMGDLKRKAHITYQTNKNSILGTMVHRTKTQYRVLFRDEANSSTKAIFYTFQEKAIKGVTKVEYPVLFSCLAEGDDTLGNVLLVAGDDDGFVHKLDKGTSFDGEPIVTLAHTAFYHYATPRLWKRFLRVLFEISSPDKVQFFVKPEFNYNGGNMLKTLDQEIRTAGQGGKWGFITWGSFVWGSSSVSNPMIYMAGYGFNMGMQIATSSKYFASHNIHNMITDYSNGSRFM